MEAATATTPRAVAGVPATYAEAFAALRSLEVDGAFELASWSNGLARVLARLGRADETEPMLREALNVRCRAFGDDCPIRRATIEQLAEHLVAGGRCGEAVPLLRESIAASERVGESDSARAARTRELLAACGEDAR